MTKARTKAAAHHSFGDRLARFFEENGLPRMAGRVLAHLLICEPAEQTFDEVVAATGASRSTISVATRLLIRLGLVERFGIPGERRDRYRIREDAWSMLLRQDLVVATQLKQMAEDGLQLLALRPRPAKARLRAMKEFYSFLEESYAPLLARWEKRRAEAQPNRSSS